MSFLKVFSGCSEILMRHAWFWTFLLGLILAGCFHPTKQQDSQVSSSVNRIAFGSCNRQDLPQPLWGLIKKDQPQVFVWSGDVVYTKTESEAERLEAYKDQLENPGYLSLRNEPSIRVLGTWDDHDYGKNNGGAEYSQKDLSQKLFLDFLAEKPESERRKQKGLYAAYDLGSKDKLVRIVLLDVRYHKRPVGSDEYFALLGEAQWMFLQQQLQDSPAKVHVIVSGIQILSQEHPYESWGQYPKERDRLFELIRKHKPKGVVLISGDRHIAEISRLSLGRDGKSDWLYDITSSGMTHSFENHPGELNSLRVHGPYTQIHYGRLNIDWAGPSPQVTAEIVGVDGKVVLSEVVVPRL